MMKSSRLSDLIADAIRSPEYFAEAAVLDFTEHVCQIMRDQGVCRADLARRLGKSRAWVTRLLNGSHNLTIATMSEVLVSLGHRPVVQAAPIHTGSEARHGGSPGAVAANASDPTYEEDPSWKPVLEIVQGGSDALAA